MHQAGCLGNPVSWAAGVHQRGEQSETFGLGMISIGKMRQVSDILPEIIPFFGRLRATMKKVRADYFKV